MSKTPAQINEFYCRNMDAFLALGSFFTEKISDRDFLEELAKKDFEKLARIFKLVFERLEDAGEQEQPTPALSAIISAFGGLGKGGGESD